VIAFQGWKKVRATQDLNMAFQKVAMLKDHKKGNLHVVWTEKDNTEAVTSARAVWADKKKLKMLKEAFEVCEISNLLCLIIAFSRLLDAAVVSGLDRPVEARETLTAPGPAPSFSIWTVAAL